MTSTTPRSTRSTGTTPAPRRSECGVSVWAERDRLHIHVFHQDENTTVVDWWDDDARQMFEDGFFRTGRPFGIREDDARLRASVLDYCEARQLIRP